jgi:hypothetical protein
MGNENIFKEIYANNTWNDNFSRSGTGSNLEQTKRLREILPVKIEQYKIKSLLDLPCGDFYWMAQIKDQLSKSLEKYIGGDIVEEIVEINRYRHGDSVFSFRYLDLLSSELPNADLILCRDCLVHFEWNDIMLALSNIKRSGIKYLACTTFPDRTNRNILTGGWQPLNLERFPFYLTNPMDRFEEECSQENSAYNDKSIAIWEVSKIRLWKFSIILTSYNLTRGAISLIKRFLR